MIADLIIRWLGPALERAGFVRERAATRQEAAQFAQAAYEQSLAAIREAGPFGVPNLGDPKKPDGTGDPDDPIPA